MRDRVLLQRDLPPGIFVKMFEDRLDLISALIEGDYGTPYDGCLFYFDIQLDKRHPYKPPQVDYYSFCGQQLNPNLDTDGTVRLPLLDPENWTCKSTIHELLMSIKNLTLVKEPFLNEPNLSQAKNSISALSAKYNTKIVPFVLDSIKQQIQNPPKIFKKHVVDHYKNFGWQIFMKTRLYVIDDAFNGEYKVPFPFDKSEEGKNQIESAQRELYPVIFPEKKCSCLKQTDTIITLD